MKALFAALFLCILPAVAFADAPRAERCPVDPSMGSCGGTTTNFGGPPHVAGLQAP